MDFLNNPRAVFQNLQAAFLSPVKTWVDSLRECNLRVAESWAAAPVDFRAAPVDFRVAPVDFRAAA